MNKKETLHQLTPELALQKLIEGNLRFQKSEHINRDFMQETREVAAEKYPVMII